MVKTVLLTLVLVLAGSVLMHFLVQVPSAVLLIFGDISFELSLWFAAFLICLVFAVILLAWRLWRGSTNTIARGVRRVKTRRQRRVRAHAETGLLNFMEGNWQVAKRELTLAAPETDAPAIHYLAAARSAYELGDMAETQRLLAEAKAAEPEQELAVAVSQARMCVQDGRYEQALTLLTGLSDAAQRQRAVLDCLVHAYSGLGEWSALLNLMPRLRSAGYLDNAGLRRIENLAYDGLMTQALTVDSASPESARTAWENLPKAQRQRATQVSRYAEFLGQHQQVDQANRVIERHLKRQWDPALVRLFAGLPASSPEAQLKRAESWLARGSGDARLLLALGQLCRQCNLWGKARDYFEQSLKLEETAAGFAAMGDLLADLGEHANSVDYYRRGLNLAVADH